MAPAEQMLAAHSELMRMSREYRNIEIVNPRYDLGFRAGYVARCLARAAQVRALAAKELKWERVNG